MRTWFFPILTAVLVGCTAQDSGDTGKDVEVLDGDGDGVTVADDCDDADASAYPGATEACDGVDNDCDGETDEADATGTATFYTDADGDSFGDADAAMTACVQPAGTVADSTDCNDDDAAINPSASETCNEVDDDCDGDVDDGLATTDYYPDGDSDGYGDDTEMMSACADPGGMITVGGDCDDTDPGVNPDAVERCDASDVDEDCDGNADDDDSSVTETLVYYMDMDGDGYGMDTMSTDACDAPGGYVREGGDCDDGNEDAYPGAEETCNRVDDDCDGEEDNGLLFETWYYDGDGDTYGDASLSVTDCAPVDGYVTAIGDCDDSAASINPGAMEMCDDADLDEDCDGLVDDADDSVTGTSTWYVDTDGDGYGDDDMTMATCDMPDGYVDNAWDPWEDVSATDLVDTEDLSEVTDLVVTDGGLYAVGTDGDGDAIVVWIDGTTGAVSEVFSGEPLSYPTGIALSADGSMLYVADIAADSGSRSVSGGVFEIPVDGGSATEVGTAGTVDLPVDVAVSGDGTMLYVTGLDLGGDGAIFSVDLSSGMTMAEVTGSPLSDPLSIAASADGSMVYAVDSYASHGRGAVLAFDTASWTNTMDLAAGFGVAFPGGLALDESGETAFFSSINAGDVVAVKTDGSLSDVVYDATGLTPGGLGVMGEWIYVANLTDSPDITTLSY